jgi:hypothetical protein
MNTRKKRDVVKKTELYMVAPMRKKAMAKRPWSKKFPK